MEKKEVAFDLRQLTPESFLTYNLIDIREPVELMMKPINGFECQNLPLSQLSQHADFFKPQEKYLLFCEKGIRSGGLAAELRKHGISDAFSVIGGADAVNLFIAEHKNSLSKV